MSPFKLISFTLLCIRITYMHAECYFNPLFLGGDVASLCDLSLISQGNNISPGVYYFDVYVSDRFIKNTKINFVESGSKEKTVEPCFTNEFVKLMPFNKKLMAKLVDQDKSPEKCIDLKNIDGLHIRWICLRC